MDKQVSRMIEDAIDRAVEGFEDVPAGSTAFRAHLNEVLDAEVGDRVRIKGPEEQAVESLISHIYRNGAEHMRNRAARLAKAVDKDVAMDIRELPLEEQV